MKLEPAVKKETVTVALGTLALAVVFNIVFFIVSLLAENVTYDGTVPLGSLYGAVFSILNFFLMALTVQSAMSNEDNAKKKMQLSFSSRMLLLLLALGFGVYLQPFHWLGVLTSAVFPRIVIFIRGFYLKKHPEALAEPSAAAGDGGEQP